MARLFVSQETLDDWNASNRAELSGDRLTVDGRTYTISSAVYFAKVAGGDADAHDLVGKVKAEDELARMGAEQYHNSVICGDNAYDVVCGFVGVPIGG
jgi:hypothetical protein